MTYRIMLLVELTKIKEAVNVTGGSIQCQR